MFSWVKQLFGNGTTSFRDYERRVLDAVAEALPAEARQRLTRRVLAVNLVQRIDGGREVNCYVMQHGKPVLDSSTRVDESTGEHLLAKFEVDGPPGTGNTGQVWLVEGNLFSIEFDEATEHANADAIKSLRVMLA